MQWQRGQCAVGAVRKLGVTDVVGACSTSVSWSSRLWVSPVRQVPVSLGQRPPLHVVKLIIRLRALEDHTLLLPFQPELM